MKPVAKFFLITICLFFAATSGGVHAQDAKKPKDAKSASREKAKTNNKPQPEKSASPDKIEIPIPIGDVVSGIKIPHYNEKGELAMQFEAETAKRLDDSRIEMTNLKIQINEDNKKYYIAMPHAIFNMDTKILISDTPATILREDFEIVGETAEFNTKTKNSKMTGNVTMTLFNTDMNQK